MFEFVRVALFATLTIGATTVARSQVNSVTVDGPVQETLPAPSLPAQTSTVETLPEVAAPDGAAPASADVVAPLPPPKSLGQLVGRYATTGAADDETACLATAVYFESKGEPLEGQLAVARTIMNRTTSGRFARSLCGVIRQRGQFSFMHGSQTVPATHREAKNWCTALAIARIAMDDLWTGPVRNALYFHARQVAPRWGMTRVASLGNHIFYR